MYIHINSNCSQVKNEGTEGGIRIRITMDTIPPFIKCIKERVSQVFIYSLFTNLIAAFHPSKAISLPSCHRLSNAFFANASTSSFQRCFSTSLILGCEGQRILPASSCSPAIRRGGLGKKRRSYAPDDEDSQFINSTCSRMASRWAIRFERWI